MTPDSRRYVLILLPITPMVLLEFGLEFDFWTKPSVQHKGVIIKEMDMVQVIKTFEK